MLINCKDAPCPEFLSKLERKTIITGHYGSGKTEFAISLALQIKQLCQENHPCDTSQENRPRDKSVSVIDLDIVNPYFRSREKRDFLRENGISVYGSLYEQDIGAELPALGANIKAPLEDKTGKVIIDTGGDDTGALVLNQFGKYFNDNETKTLIVVNTNRPETGDITGAIKHINAIENITGLEIHYIVNNTHMLRETTVSDIQRGYELCTELCAKTGKTLLCTCYPFDIINPATLNIPENLMPLGLFIRPTWLDK